MSEDRVRPLHPLQPRARLDPKGVRDHIADVNDGVLAVAGFSEGLAGAGMATSAVYGLIMISALAGAIGAAGTKLGEAAADREAEQRVVAEETRLLELSPEEEIAELAAHFESKGVTPPTARKVAESLSAADALSAQLEMEYGIRALTARGYPMRAALWSALAFLFGATVPLVVAYFVPDRLLDEFTLIAVVISLGITGALLAVLGRTEIWWTLLRSVVIGLSSLGASYVLASWLL